VHSFYISHETERNQGQRPIYYDSGHHEGIVTREQYLQALLLLSSNKNSQGISANYRLTVIREGLLTGFIPINRAFGGYNASHFIQAVLNVQNEGVCFESRDIQMMDLPGFQIARTQDFGHSQKIIASISSKNITFNKECAVKLPCTEYAEILFHPTEKLLAVRASAKNNENAIQWLRVKDNKLRSVIISCTAFSSVLYELMGWRKEWRLKIVGICLTKNDESVLLFDFHDTEYRIFREDIESAPVDVERKKRRNMMTLHPATWRNSFGYSMPEHAIVSRWDKTMLFDRWQIGAPGLPVKGFEHNVNICSTDDIQQQIDELQAIEA
jgi:hypothetical protein